MTETERTLTVTRQDHPAGPLLMALGGDLDYHTARRLSQALDEVPFTPGTDVIVDLSELDYCDSTGLTVLIGAHQRAEAAGTTFSIVGVGRDLERVFSIVGLDQYFAMYPTAEAALRHLGT